MILSALLQSRSWRGGGQGGVAADPPGPVKPDISSLWMELFPLDSLMFDIFIFEVDFSETYPRQVLKIASKLENFLVEDTPRPPYKAPAFGTRDNTPPPFHPHYKKKT